MAPYIPVPDVLQCEVRYRLNGEEIENVMYFDYSAVGFDTAVTDIGLNFFTNVWTPLRASYAPAMQILEMYFTDLASVSGPTATYSVGMPQSGTGVLDSAANNAALVICFRTAQRGRSYRGRNYLAGFIESLCNNSIWDVAFVPNLLGFYETFRVAALADGETMVVVSRFTGGAPRTVGVATPVTAIVNTTRATRSQRRRNPGVGI